MKANRKRKRVVEESDLEEDDRNCKSREGPSPEKSGADGHKLFRRAKAKKTVTFRSEVSLHQDDGSGEDADFMQEHSAKGDHRQSVAEGRRIVLHNDKVETYENAAGFLKPTRQFRVEHFGAKAVARDENNPESSGKPQEELLLLGLQLLVCPDAIPSQLLTTSPLIWRRGIAKSCALAKEFPALTSGNQMRHGQIFSARYHFCFCSSFSPLFMQLLISYCLSNINFLFVGNH